MKGLNLALLPLGFYFFLLLLSLFLAGTVGGPLTGAAALLLFFLLADVSQVAVTVMGIRIKEDFSADHPVKGQELEYSLGLEAGWLPIRSSRMDMELRFSSPFAASQGERITFWLGAGGKKKFSRTFRCLYRGNYTLGLASLEVRSWTGWFTWSVDLWPRTFYVLPRVFTITGNLPLPSFPGPGNAAFLPDQSLPTLFDHTVPYREGIPLKYVDWKPLARGGAPVARHYLPESWNHVSIYVDLFRSGDAGEIPGVDVLEAEDMSVETAASLLSALTAGGIPAACRTWTGMTAAISSGRTFHDWLESTVQWQFRPCPSLALLWKSGGKGASAAGDIFITHRLDPELVDLVGALRGDRILIAVTRSWQHRERELWSSARESLRRSGAAVYEVQALEDLGRISRG